MPVESEKSKSSAAAAVPGSCRSNETFPRRRKAILRRSGGIESELTEDDLLTLRDEQSGWLPLVLKLEPDPYNFVPSEGRWLLAILARALPSLHRDP